MEKKRWGGVAVGRKEKQRLFTQKEKPPGIIRQLREAAHHLCLSKPGAGTN